MIDVISAASTAISDGSATAPVFVALAGVVSGIGPCAGVRGAVLMSIVAGGGRSQGVRIGAFVGGIVAAYTLLAFVLPLFAQLLNRSAMLYAILALVLIVSGARSIVGSRHHCEGRKPDEPPSIGAVFGAGLASSAILSPCCTPLILCILSTQAQNGHLQAAALLLAGFALGHALPMVAMTLALAAPLRRFFAWAQGDSAAIVGGALQIGVGAFYAVLA